MHVYVFPRTVSSGLAVAGSERRWFRPSWRRLEAAARGDLTKFRKGCTVTHVSRELVNGRRSVWLNWSRVFDTGR